MARTEAELTADAQAENYWSMVAKRNETQRAYRSRPLCTHCKVRPVAATPGEVFCQTDLNEYRRQFGTEL